MKIIHLALLLSAGLFQSTFAPGAYGLGVSSFHEKKVIPGTFLVEFENGQDSDGFFADLDSAGVEYEVRKRFDSKLFKGASFKIVNTPDSDDVSATRIASHPKVNKSWPLHGMQYPDPERRSVARGGHKSPKLKRRDEKIPFAPHVMTQIDQLHKAGYTGKGVRIGIIDTGVDYHHPALGGCFGKGCVVSYGWDLAGDDYNITTAPKEDKDPLDTVVGHGTHVSGIVGAQENEYGFVGAAPGAEIGMFKTCGTSGFTSPDIIIAGMLKAVDDGSDVLSLSVGFESGWSQHPVAVVAERIVDSGVPVVVATGNSGDYGLFTVSAPSSGENVTSIGAAANTEIPMLLLQGHWSIEDEEEQEFGWLAGTPDITANLSLPLWAASTDFEEGNLACDPLPDDTPDLSGKFVLVRDDTSKCDSIDQADNLAEKGAEYVFFYSTMNATSIPPTLGDTELQGIASVPPPYALSWLKALDEGRNVTISIPDSSSAEEMLEYFANDLNAGGVTTFSSWGPTWEVNLKPQILAPGGDILSLLPIDQGGYGVLSGTSMATPLAAGLVALIMEARGSKDAALIRQLLVSQAKPVKYFNGKDTINFSAPAPQQGTGLAQGMKSIKVQAAFSTDFLSFNDTDNFAGNHTVRLINNGDRDMSFMLSHIEGPTYNTFDAETKLPQGSGGDFSGSSAEITFDADTIDVPAKGSTEFIISGTAPAAADPDLMPVYGGYIKAVGDDDTTLLLPYVGIASSLSDQAILLPGKEGATFLSEWLVSGQPEAEANKTFTVDRPVTGDIQEANVGAPAYVFTLRVGSQILRADVVAVGETDLPTEDFFGRKVVGSIRGFPSQWAPSVGYSGPFTGALDDGTVVPAGTYQMVISAVRIHGDPKNEDDWDIVEMVPFHLKYGGEKR